MPLNSLNDNGSIPRLSVGDSVQIKFGAVDLVTEKVITSKDLYSENSSSYGRVENIIENFKPKASLGLTGSVTAVQVGNGNGVIMRTVQIQDIASNRIIGSNSQLAVSTLSSLTSAVNSRNISAINNILNSSLNIVNAFGTNSNFTNSITSAFSKAMEIDQESILNNLNIRRD